MGPSVVIIGVNSLADLAQVAAAGDLARSWVIAVDAIVLGWLLSGRVRRAVREGSAAVAAPGCAEALSSARLWPIVTEPEPDWRQRKKNATRDRIRASALRLFGEQGYDATTVEQIAAAAGVSHMTFFRYFPAKEDVALSDSYDPLLASADRTDPGRLALHPTGSARCWSKGSGSSTTPTATPCSPRTSSSSPPPRCASGCGPARWTPSSSSSRPSAPARTTRTPASRTRVTVAACLAAATTAILTWVENDGTPELPDLIEQAFDTISHLR